MSPLDPGDEIVAGDGSVWTIERVVWRYHVCSEPGYRHFVAVPFYTAARSEDGRADSATGELDWLIGLLGEGAQVRRKPVAQLPR